MSSFAGFQRELVAVRPVAHPLGHLFLLSIHVYRVSSRGNIQNFCVLKAIGRKSIKRTHLPSCNGCSQRIVCKLNFNEFNYQ